MYSRHCSIGAFVKKENFALINGGPFKFLLLALAIRSSAQTSASRIHGHNIHSWFVYSGDHAVSKRWGVHLEGQWRRHDGPLRPQQLLLRPALNFQLKPKIAFSAGYAFVSTHRYGRYPVAAPFPEHRLYQQVTIARGAGRYEFQHRFRNEQRWIGQRLPQAGGGIRDIGARYQNRFRYMVRLTVALKKEPWYLPVSNEVFLNYAPVHGAKTFDQNRLFAGIGRKLGRDSRIEGGYMQQTLLQRNARVLEFNHTLQLTIFSRIPWRK